MEMQQNVMKGTATRIQGGNVMVKGPICNFCAKTRMLCPKCQEKIKKGEVPEIGIELMNLLQELERKWPLLQKVEISQVFTIQSKLLLGVNKKAASLLSTHQDLLEEIRQRLQVNQIIVIPILNNVKKQVAAIFQPYHVNGIDQVYVPGGPEEVRIRVQVPESLQKSEASIENEVKFLEEVTRLLLKTPVSVMLEG